MEGRSRTGARAITAGPRTGSSRDGTKKEPAERTRPAVREENVTIRLMTLNRKSDRLGFVTHEAISAGSWQDRAGSGESGLPAACQGDATEAARPGRVTATSAASDRDPSRHRGGVSIPVFDRSAAGRGQFGLHRCQFLRVVDPDQDPARPPFDHETKMGDALRRRDREHDGSFRG